MFSTILEFIHRQLNCSYVTCRVTRSGILNKALSPSYAILVCCSEGSSKLYSTRMPSVAMPEVTARQFISIMACACCILLGTSLLCSEKNAESCYCYSYCCSMTTNSTEKTHFMYIIVVIYAAMIANAEKSSPPRNTTFTPSLLSRKTITIVNDEAATRVCCSGLDKP